MDRPPSQLYFLDAFFRGLAFGLLAVAGFFFLPLDPPNAAAQLSEYFFDAPLRRSDMSEFP